MQAKFLSLFAAIPIALASAANGQSSPSPSVPPSVPVVEPGMTDAAIDAAEPAGMKLVAALGGAEEVNAQGERNQGAAHGTGSFSGWISPAMDQLCYTLTWDAIEHPTAAHIHTGKSGQNGGVFIPLTDLTSGDHCIKIDSVKATAIAASPGDYYVNVHNASFPAGAARGQLVAPDAVEPAAG